MTDFNEPAGGVREARARAIYEAMGFAYDGRTVGTNGPYGEWATAIKAADAIAALSSSAGPAGSVVSVRFSDAREPEIISWRMMPKGEHALFAHPAPATVEMAVAAEREACAKLCDRRRKKDAEFEGGRNSYSHFSSLTARDLANEIRARAALAPATEGRKS